MQDNSKITVYVGLSGGVDSSVSAYLLKKQSYKVVGVFIRGWQPDWIPCTWKEDRISAMRTASYLDIPFKTLDLEKEYKEIIVDYMLSEYAKGNTPNGDMLCNKEIKFGLFLKYALENGAQFVATGHYARTTNSKISLNPLYKTSKIPLTPFYKGGIEQVEQFKLLEGIDKNKDQSYFLSQLNQQQLAKIIFPLGELTKKEVREIATKADLPVANRDESFGMCFVGDITMKDFLKNELRGNKNLQIGKVINEKGEEIGEHDGAILYTIGERHGFRIDKKFQTTENKNLYVIKKDLEKNILVVAEQTTPSFASQNPPLRPEGEFPKLDLEKISFINQPLKKSDILQIRVRHRGEKINAQILEINLNNKTCELKIIDEQYQNLQVAKGQFVVFYNSEECLGGGVLV